MNGSRRMIFAVCTLGVTWMFSAAFVSAAEEALDETKTVKTLPLNQWVQLSTSGTGLQKPVWTPDLNAAVLWAGTKEKRGRCRTFTATEGKWSILEASFPARQNFPPLDFTMAAAYLPQTKKVLYVRANSLSFAKQPATTWLMDPTRKEWTIQTDKLWMCDKSSDFNPSTFARDWTVPFWGDLIYDASNKEAVAFGGAGTWGRVSKEKETVGPLDWMYDETMEPKRVRRLTEKDGEVMARKWYPAHVGTWIFSEATGKWAATRQPLREQPPGRVNAQLAYDSDEKKIVLFGGDNRARTLGDTWIYDCATRTWKEVKPKGAPQPRAFHAMVYIPEQKVVLLAGGYKGGWKALKDVWVYSVPKNEWIKLNLDLPEASMYCTGYYDPSMNAPVVTGPGMCALKLDLASAPKAAPDTFTPRSVWHSVNGNWRGKLPEEWLSGKLAPDPNEDGRNRLASLPANQWVNPNPPAAPIERNWGSYIYDVKTHRVFAWGGGHSTYPGSDISEYDVLSNRWRNQAEPTEYYPPFKHRMSVGMPGVSFFGYSVLPCHARKSYGVDPISHSVITWPGDVYSIDHHLVLSSIGPCPPRPWFYGYFRSIQPAYVTAPSGLYAYHKDRRPVLYRANVKMGKWDAIDRTGPKGRSEFAFLCADPKRNRLIYFPYENSKIWAFDLKTKKWAEEKVQGPTPARPMGDATYVPSMDAILLIFVAGKGQPEKLHFYKLAERRWYTAPSAGKPSFTNTVGKDRSPHYDPELGVLVRIGGPRFGRPIAVNLMRLVPEELQLTPLSPK